MSDELPYYKFYPDDFVGSGKVGAMCTLAVGAYKLLLCKAWRENPVGTIPNDDRVLRLWSRLTEAEWGSVRAEVLAAFTLGSDGRYYQARMRREYDEIKKKSALRAKAGEKGAEARWQKNGKRMANASHAQSGSDSLLPDPPKPILKQNTDRQCDELYRLYPRHVKSIDAKRAISKALQIKSFEFLKDAVSAYALAVSKWPPYERQFIPYPASWFNSASYDDDRAEWVRASPSKGNPYGKSERPGVFRTDSQKSQLAALGKKPSPTPSGAPGAAVDSCSGNAEDGDSNGVPF